jgi:hypothetical protein
LAGWHARRVYVPGATASESARNDRHHCSLSDGGRIRSVHSCCSFARTWLSNAPAEPSGLLADLNLLLMVFLLYLDAIATVPGGS